jgi:hypothetical protein
MVGGHTSTQTTCLAIAHTRRPRGIPETVVTRRSHSMPITEEAAPEVDAEDYKLIAGGIRLVRA